MTQPGAQNAIHWLEKLRGIIMRGVILADYAVVFPNEKDRIRSAQYAAIKVGTCL